MATTLDAVLGLPMAKVSAAYASLGLTLSTALSKATMAKAVAEAIDRGRLTLAGVRGMAPATPQPVPAPAGVSHSDLASLNTALTAAIGNVAAQAETATRAGIAAGVAADNARDRLDRLDVMVSDLGRSIKGQIETLADSVGRIKVDPSTVDAAIRAAVESAFQPIAQVAQANGTESAVLAVAQAQATGQGSALDVFGVDVRDVKGRPLMFATYGHPDAPAIDPCFIWTESIIRHLYIAHANGRNIWMGGPAGTGKTQTAQQFAARTGRMFRRFVFDRFSTRDDFLGAMGLDAGSTRFEPGPVLDAYCTPGAVCLLDEVGMGQPAALSALNAFLERGAQVAYADRVWHRGVGNMFLAADNSLGQGDTSGRFAGVQAMNTAFLERFSLVLPFNYLDPDTEAQALVKHTGCTRTLADHLVSALGVIRGKVNTGDIVDAPSIRQMVAFIEACHVLPVAEAWRSAITARQPAESEAGLAAAFAACINQSLVEGEI